MLNYVRSATVKLQSAVDSLDAKLQVIEGKVEDKAINLKEQAANMNIVEKIDAVASKVDKKLIQADEILTKAVTKKKEDPFTNPESESKILRDPSTSVYDKILSIIGEDSDEDSDGEEQEKDHFEIGLNVTNDNIELGDTP